MFSMLSRFVLQGALKHELGPCVLCESVIGHRLGWGGACA